MRRVIVIVARDQRDLHEYLKRGFEGVEGVEVILDRRVHLGVRLRGQADHQNGSCNAIGAGNTPDDVRAFLGKHLVCFADSRGKAKHQECGVDRNTQPWELRMVISVR